MKKFYRIVTYIAGAIVLLLCCYIMARGLGLQSSLDFGAGAYYYADIPDFEKYTSASYPTDIPLWVYIALFLAWGYLMWRLWAYIENKKQ